MDLTAALWYVVSAGALIFAISALVQRLISRSRMSATTRRSTATFGILMFLFGVACLCLAVYETLA